VALIQSRPNRAHAQENVARVFLFLASTFVIVAMGAILLYLTFSGLRLFTTDHISPLLFLFSPDFSPDDKHPGALVFILGSVGVTLFSLCVGGPLGIAVGIFLSQLAPKRLSNVMKPAIEVLVGIPSVVYGWLGLVLLVPLVRNVTHNPTGFGLLTAGIVLSIMILPTVISLSEDALYAVQTSIKEASMALGATRWQTIWNVMLPAARSGLMVALILGIARAIGEALAVQMVIGNSAVLMKSLVSPTASLTTEIVTDMGSAPEGSILYHALFSMAFLLLIISMGLILVVRVALRRKA